MYVYKVNDLFVLEFLLACNLWVQAVNKISIVKLQPVSCL